MNNIKTYLKNILIAIDQLCNTIFIGWPDETLSSRAWRLSRDNIRQYPRKIIDTLFWWDKNETKGHCELSYESEKIRAQCPPELRPEL